MRTVLASFVACVAFALLPLQTGAVSLEFAVPDCGFPCNGDAVAIDGDTTAFTRLDTLNGTVIVDVYVRNDGAWHWQAGITDPLLDSDPDAAGASEFGTLLALQGDTLLVAATGFGTRRLSRIVAFQRTGAHWSHTQTLNFLGTGSGAVFTGLALRGNTAAIGVLESARVGRVYVFERRNGLFTRRADVGREFMGRNGGDESAYPLAFDGDTLVIGSATENESRGAAYTYRRSGAVWRLQQKLIDSTAAAGDRFGNSVAVLGDSLAIGRLGPEPMGTNPHGQVNMYTRSSGAWVLQQVLRSPGPVLPNYMFWTSTFGSRLAFGEGKLIASANYPFDRFFEAPGAHLFELVAGVWTPTALIDTAGPLQGAAISADHAVLSGDSLRWANSVFIYDLETP
jgi:hypothetical protein